MQDLLAYALRAEYEGTVDVEGETVDVYQGGLVALPDGSDFDVKEALATGDGTIVVRARDTVLTMILGEYPPLKAVSPPAQPAAIVSIYARLPLAELRHQASLRDLVGAGNASKRAIVAALEAQDAALAAGDQAAANAVRVGDVADGLDKLTKAQLLDLAPEGVDLGTGATNAEIIAALRERGITANPED